MEQLKKYILWWKKGITAMELAEQLREWDEDELVKLLRFASDFLHPEQKGNC